MTREEAQALAEEIATEHARVGEPLGLERAAHLFEEGVHIFSRSLRRGETPTSRQIACLAGCAIELLRESFLACGGSAEGIRAGHQTPPSLRPPDTAN